MRTEEDIRRKVRKIQQFYMNLLVFVGVNVFFSLIWLTSERGTPFWPKYIIVIWGILLIVKAFRMKLFSQYIPFLNPEWEKHKIEELMNKEQVETTQKKTTQKKVDIQSKSTLEKKVETPKKSSVSKKNSAVKAKKTASTQKKKTS